MNIFNEFIEEARNVIADYEITKLQGNSTNWPLSDDNIFLMDKDSAVELGGYPKESVNLILAGSAKLPVEKGIYVIGSDKIPSEGHISFGKVVFVRTEGKTNEDTYTFMQDTVLTDTRLKFEGVMNRTSSKHYYTNLKISKKALKDGFNAVTMAETIKNSFEGIDGAAEVAVILIMSEDDSIYKRLLPIAKKTKDVTVTLNHIFDGVEMDCARCDFTELCSEVEGMKKLHENMANEARTNQV